MYSDRTYSYPNGDSVGIETNTDGDDNEVFLVSSWDKAINAWGPAYLSLSDAVALAEFILSQVEKKTVYAFKGGM